MLSDTKSNHVTQPGGNVFADLGFGPEEAIALQTESRRLIYRAAAAMADFNFSLTFKLHASDSNLQEVVRRLGTAGWVFRHVVTAHSGLS